MEVSSTFLGLRSSPTAMTTTAISSVSAFPTSSPTASVLSSVPSSHQMTLSNSAKIGIVIGMMFAVVLAVFIGFFLSRRNKISRLRHASISEPLEHSKPKDLLAQ
jgi:hypothetical protein